MKMISSSESLSPERNNRRQVALRWGARLFGHKEITGHFAAKQTIEFMLTANSLCRVAGNLSGLRIICRQGRLWVTQTGEVADVILRPGQIFVSRNEGAILIQPVAAPADEIEVCDTERDRPYDEVACGLVIAPAGDVQLKVEREPKSATRTAIGLEISRNGAVQFSEKLAFAVLGVSSLVAVGYCLRTVLTLPWPG